MNKKILVIGGTGVLSSSVVTEAMQNGFEITMINRGNRPVPMGVTHIKCDKNDYDYIKEKIDKSFFLCVIDFLCYNDEDTKDSITFYSKYTDQYFFISSCAVYDKTKSGVKDENSAKPLNIWSYSVNKFQSEERLKEISKQLKCNYTIIRPCVTYDNTRIPYGIMPPYGFHWTFCARILNGKPIIRWNGGVTKSNMMRVEDFAVGMVGLIGNPKAYNESFNICGDETPSFNDVLNALESVLDSEIKIIDVSSEYYAKENPVKKEEILGGRSIDSINSNEKIKLVVPNFKQNIYLKEGLTKTIESYKNNNYQKGIDWTFDADTDRIVKKWCITNGIDYKKYNLAFIDYLGTATITNKLTYWCTYHKDKYFARLVLYLLNLYLKISQIIKNKF